MSDSNITTAWKRIEQWLTTHAPPILASLGDPASAESIAELERAIGRPIAIELKASLFMHDGQHRKGLLPYSGFLGPEPAYELFPVSQITAEWTMMKELVEGGDFQGLDAEPDKEISNDWWNPSWVPFAWNGGGDYFCVDLCPSDGGTIGQVIHFAHDSPQRQLIAPSVSTMLQSLADDVESGTVVFSGKGLVYANRRRGWNA